MHRARPPGRSPIGEESVGWLISHASCQLSDISLPISSAGDSPVCPAILPRVAHWSQLIPASDAVPAAGHCHAGREYVKPYIGFLLYVAGLHEAALRCTHGWMNQPSAGA